MKRNVIHTIPDVRKQLAVCSTSRDGYECMKYYVAIWYGDIIDPHYYGLCCSLGAGYFVHNYVHGGYDFFTKEEFQNTFIVVESGLSSNVCIKANILFKWLKSNKGITVLVYPAIKDNGYNYSYDFHIDYDFAYSQEEHDFDSYELAVKKAMNLVRKKCLNKFGSSIKKWMSFIVVNSPPPKGRGFPIQQSSLRQGFP